VIAPWGPRIWTGDAPQDAPSLSRPQTVRMPRASTNVKDRFGWEAAIRSSRLNDAVHSIKSRRRVRESFSMRCTECGAVSSIRYNWSESRHHSQFRLEIIDGKVANDRHAYLKGQLHTFRDFSAYRDIEREEETAGLSGN
jgi:hypothetical protein